jgi:hypothetical protein
MQYEVKFVDDVMLPDNKRWMLHKDGDVTWLYLSRALIGMTEEQLLIAAVGIWAAARELRPGATGDGSAATELPDDNLA